MATIVFDTPPLTEVITAAVVTGAIIGLGLLDRRVGRDPLLFWVFATSLILVALDHVSNGLIVGLAVAAVALVPADQRLQRAVLVAGVAIATVSLTRNLDAWLQWAALGVVACAGPLFWDSYRRSGDAVTMVVIAGTAFGIYVNVPDTEQISVVAAGLVVLSVATVLFAKLRSGSVRFESLAFTAALIIGSAATGARGRPAAFIGVVGALGVLLAEPVAARVRRGTAPHPVVLVVVHAGAVLVSSRVAGIRERGPATAIVAAVLVCSALLLMVIPRRNRSATTSIAGP